MTLAPAHSTTGSAHLQLDNSHMHEAYIVYVFSILVPGRNAEFFQFVIQLVKRLQAQEQE